MCSTYILPDLVSFFFGRVIFIDDRLLRFWRKARFFVPGSSNIELSNLVSNEKLLPRLITSGTQISNEKFMQSLKNFPTYLSDLNERLHGSPLLNCQYLIVKRVPLRGKYKDPHPDVLSGSIFFKLVVIYLSHLRHRKYHFKRNFFTRR